MKLKIFGSLAFIAILTACGGNEKPKSISELENPTINDSIGHFIGQNMSMEYWRAAVNMDTLQTQNYKDQYVEGFEKGLKMATANEAYNKGILDGMNLALSLRDFDKNFQTSVNKKVITEGLKYGLQSDSTVNRVEFQKEYSFLMQSVQDQKDARDKVALDSLLKQKTTKDGYKYVNGIITKVVTPGDKGKLAEGDTIGITMLFKDANGKAVASMPSEPFNIVVGKFPYSQFINRAVKTMDMGGESIFIGSAFDIFGFQMPPQSNLNKYDLVEVTLTTSQKIVE